MKYSRRNIEFCKKLEVRRKMLEGNVKCMQIGIKNVTLVSFRFTPRRDTGISV